MRIVVVGAGYVGFSLALLLSPRHNVTVVDINEQKVRAINNGTSPIHDESVEAAFSQYTGQLTATLPHDSVYVGADTVIIAAPTNYDVRNNSFDTTQVVSITAEVLQQNPNCSVIVKSTVPIGFTAELSKKHPDSIILFSPEFLREGRAYEDNLIPSRIIVGIPAASPTTKKQNAYTEAAERTLAMFAECAQRDCPQLLMSSTEAEAVKLFSNSYLALRVAFFNELDTYARARELNSGNIITGVCHDPRIGMYYNNPSFGYGGYCLPKDTKQLLANYENIPQNLIEAIVDSNRTRKDFITDEITSRVLQLVYAGVTKPIVGVYRLNMKAGSSNSRSSSVLGVMRRLRERGIAMQVYEPQIANTADLPEPLIEDFSEFISTSDLIITNRWDPKLSQVQERVYSCDLFEKD